MNFRNDYISLIMNERQRVMLKEFYKIMVEINSHMI